MAIDSYDAPDPGDPGEDPAGDPSGFVGWVPPVPDAVDLVVETQAMLSVFAAQQFVRVDAMRVEALEDARVHGFVLSEVIERSIRLELASALGVTEAAASGLIEQAEALVHRYPAALDSLAGARITARHAALLVQAMDEVESELRDDLLPGVIGAAEALPVGSFRRQARKLIDTARAVSLEDRYAQAVQGRRVWVHPAEDGMAWLTAFLPAVEAHAIHGRLTATAKTLTTHPDETRTLDQLRADVFGDILIDGTTDTLPPEVRGIRPTVTVTVPALTLLHLNGNPDAAPATVEGIGPIPPHRARELCGAAEGWMRVLTHPETGTVLSVGRDRYRPPPDLRRLVRWRADRCMAPGCGIPATRCEIDHTIAWEHGGDTSLDNLAPLCKGHHTVKHHGRWHVQHIPGTGGALQWTSPTGRTYRVNPERPLPTFTPTPDPGTPPF